LVSLCAGDSGETERRGVGNTLFNAPVVSRSVSWEDGRDATAAARTSPKRDMVANEMNRKLRDEKVGIFIVVVKNWIVWVQSKVDSWDFVLHKDSWFDRKEAYTTGPHQYISGNEQVSKELTRVRWI
jgi:hypothetical protein